MKNGTNAHDHTWTTLLDDAIGVYSKRSQKDDEVYFVGKIEKCECGVMRMIPNDRRLRVVEVTQ